MEEIKTGYRALPPVIENPSKAETINKLHFKLLKLTKMQEAPSLCAGHSGTIVWYAKKKGYILEINFNNHPTIYVNSICTFTPTMGMDSIDGAFAQDIEEYYIQKNLGLQPERLEIFKGKESIEIMEYLRNRGFIK
jgi:hypothetical protein